MEFEQRYIIPHKGLSVGTHQFDFVVDTPFFEAAENSEILGGELSVRVELEKNSQNLVLHLEIVGEVTLPCDRCLEPFSMSVDTEEDLVVRFSESAQESDGEILWLSAAESEISLSQYIYESICLSIPYQRVHPDGACNPDMLSHFRIVSEQEFEQIEAQATEMEVESAPIGNNETLRAQLEAIKSQLEQKK